MRLLLPDEESEPGRNDRWALLPGLCCQAAGGKPEFATEISAAWLMIYLAGHLVDSVEDDDKVEEIDALGGPGSAINVANGYFLSAALMLNELSKNESAKSQVNQISADFYNTILEMASGQHWDIRYPYLTLKQWWRVAEAKTGSFFSLACRSGAMLGSDEAKRVAALSDFGFHLGLMLQVHDDIEDLQFMLAEDTTGIPDDIRRSLAFTYAVDVLPEPDKSQFLEMIAVPSAESEGINTAIDLLDLSGAGLYLLAELDRHYLAGVKSLEKAEPLEPAANSLLEMIGGLKLKL